jgi:hypothetical protein
MIPATRLFWAKASELNGLARSAEATKNWRRVSIKVIFSTNHLTPSLPKTKPKWKYPAPGSVRDISFQLFE